MILSAKIQFFREMTMFLVFLSYSYCTFKYDVYLPKNYKHIL